MAAETVTITTPLGWLKPEIDRSLGEARGALAPLRKDASEPRAALDGCAQPVRHIRGAMQLLGLEGATLVCGSVERTLETLGRQPEKLDETSVSLLDRALFALSQYVDDLAQGEPDVPLKLFPVYRELNELCGRSDAAEPELFFPDLGIVPPGARAAGTLDAAARGQLLRSARSKFQRGLIGWLKEPRDAQACTVMRAALDALDRIAGELEAPVGMWWVAAGLVELAAADVHEAATCKPLLVRTERLLRKLDGGTAADAPALMREMLYRLALAAPDCPRVAEIKAAYALDAQLPDYYLSGTLEYDVRKLEPVLDRMRTRLAAMEQAWSDYVAGDPGGLPRLRREAATLKTTARDLGHYRLVRLLDIVGLIASKLPPAYPASNEALALEMAAALLFMEGMLDHFTSPPPDIDQQVAVMIGWLLDALKPGGESTLGKSTPRDDVTQRRHFAEVRAQVAREILANLHAVERTLNDIAADPSRRDGLLALDAPMRQIAGALKMLGLTRANGVASACLHLMRLGANDHAALTRAALAWIADGLSCLGFYLDTLCHGGTPSEDILRGFVQRLSRDDAHPAGASWTTPELASTLGAADERNDGAREGDAAAPEDSGAEREKEEEAAVAPAHPSDAEAENRDGTKPEERPDPRLLEAFLVEAEELLDRIRRELARWRRNPAAIEPARELARALHTFKGSARVAGVPRLADAAHALEGRVGMAIEPGGEDAALFDALESGVAAIAADLAALHANDTAPADVTSTRSPAPPADASIRTPPRMRLDDETTDDLVARAAEIAGARLRIEAGMESVRQSLDELGESIARLRRLLRETELEAERHLQSRPRDAERGGHGFDPLELDPCARLQELTRMMAESLQDLQAVHQGMTTAACDADAALLAQGRAARGLQQKLLELRSLPFGALSGRLQRTVRRTAEELGRDAALEIDGAEVELDRSLLQRLAAPLEHMLRNALAHGIEPPEERTALGKPATGRIAIRVERSGLQIVLTLSDDGRGLDLPRIRQAAVALGLVSPSDTRPDAAIAEVIFAPGLSTAPQLSASSGRGIGLDAASTEIAALGGSIEVASKPGAGTSFRIGLPLSGAAVQVLLVRGGSERYAIPCALVDRIEEPPRPGPGANGSVSGYPLARLSRLLGKHAQPAEPERGERVLLLRRGEERMALQVDAILREQEVVLAPLGPQLARVPGLAGATVLGNEEPLLVIDPLAWRRLARPESEAPETPRSPERGPAHVLVVDDSLTARRATRRLLARAGYRVSTAKDGRDALEQIRRETPSLVVLDLEMPRMDGFELVGALRAEPGTRALPIVIVSSRLADKHRRHALELGADAFFGKPCPEDELLACVAELLGARAAARAA